MLGGRNSSRLGQRGDFENDIARVWIDGQSLSHVNLNLGGTNQRTWDLRIPSLGTHVLVIDFTGDVDAADLCDEHDRTFGTELRGGGLASQ